MTRRLLQFALAVVAFVAGGAHLASAACVDPTPTHLSLHAQPAPGSGSPVSVMWGIANNCGVVETGLRVGTDPGELAPTGTPLYGAQELYQQDVPFGQPGVYWIGAYALDEAGHRIDAVPHMVVISQPSSSATESQAYSLAAFGALATYFGDDRDFLIATGNPHFASMKSRVLQEYSDRVTVDGLQPGNSERSVTHSRWISATSRQDVAAGFQDPFVIEGQTYPVQAFAVTQALDVIDSQFSALGYPRSGVPAERDVLPELYANQEHLLRLPGTSRQFSECCLLC